MLPFWPCLRLLQRAGRRRPHKRRSRRAEEKPFVCSPPLPPPVFPPISRSLLSSTAMEARRRSEVLSKLMVLTQPETGAAPPALCPLSSASRLPKPPGRKAKGCALRKTGLVGSRLQTTRGPPSPSSPLPSSALSMACLSCAPVREVHETSTTQSPQKEQKKPPWPKQGGCTCDGQRTGTQRERCQLRPPGTNCPCSLGRRGCLAVSNFQGVDRWRSSQASSLQSFEHRVRAEAAGKAWKESWEAHCFVHRPMLRPTLTATHVCPCELRPES